MIALFWIASSSPESWNRNTKTQRARPASSKDKGQSKESNPKVKALGVAAQELLLSIQV
jgi:hypothetical protein